MSPELIITTIIAAVTIIGALLLGRRARFEAFGVKFAFSRMELADKLTILRGMIEEHQSKLYSYNTNIIRNQMCYAEGKQLTIRDALRLEQPGHDGCIMLGEHDAHIFLKLCMQQNGFAGFDGPALLEYVQSKTAQLRSIYAAHLQKQSEFLESKQFDTVVWDIFSHALEVAKCWSDKIAAEEVEFNQRYGNFLKELR